VTDSRRLRTDEPVVSGRSSRSAPAAVDASPGTRWWRNERGKLGGDPRGRLLLSSLPLLAP